MAMHLLAFRGSGVLTTSSVRQTPVTDSIVAVSNTAFVLEQAMEAVAVYAGASGITLAQVTIPASPLANALVRPIDVSATPSSDPNVAVFSDAPLRIAQQTELALVGTGSGGTLNGAVLLRDRFEPIPPGEAITIQFTAASQAVPTAYAWYTLTGVTWSHTLPPGQYAVVGFEVFRTTIVSARLILQDQIWRPGTIAMQSVGLRTHQVFYDGSLGVMGRFPAYAMPSIEIVADATTTTAEGYVRIVRVA